MELEEIQRLLKDRRLDVVSEATGIHRNTIANIRDGKTPIPTKAHLIALASYLKR